MALSICRANDHAFGGGPQAPFAATPGWTARSSALCLPGWRRIVVFPPAQTFDCREPVCHRVLLVELDPEQSPVVAPKHHPRLSSVRPATDGFGDDRCRAQVGGSGRAGIDEVDACAAARARRHHLARFQGFGVVVRYVLHRRVREQPPNNLDLVGGYRSSLSQPLPRLSNVRALTRGRASARRVQRPVRRRCWRSRYLKSTAYTVMTTRAPRLATAASV